MNSPAYYRARLETISELIRLAPDEDVPLLRNGFISDKYKIQADELINKYVLRKDDEPLYFSEICRYSTWFAMHPEKVAGKEIVTSSREFPLTLKGTKEDILQMFNMESSRSLVTEINLEAEALALELELLR